MGSKLIMVFVGIVAALAAFDVDAAREDRRQARQGARIRQGARSGELTRGEARSLRQGQRRVNRAERRAEADGEVTDQEKARIEKMQDRQSNRIQRLKNNDRKRGEKADTQDAAPAAESATEQQQ